MRKIWFSLLAVTGLLLVFAGVSLSQEKGGDDRTGGYDVVLGWPKPLTNTLKPGYIWGGEGGIFPESPNRVFIANRGELKPPDKLPNGWTGFWGSTGTAAPGGQTPVMHNCIVAVDANGNVVDAWTQWDYLFEGGRGPHSVLISPYDPQHSVWVVDDVHAQIWKFSNDGKRLLMTLGTRDEEGSDATHFKRPTDIAWLPDGTFFVSDGYGNTRVAKFDKDGKFLMSWGTPGKGPGQFNLPHSIAVDRNRRVLVADRSNNRIQVFDENGKYLDEWDNVEGPLHIAISDDPGGQTLWVHTLVLDKFMKYDMQGHLLYSWGSHGTTPGLFWSAHGFQGDSNGDFYTAESFGGRPQKFTPHPGADPMKIFHGMKLMPFTGVATGGVGPGPLQPVFTGHGSTNFSGIWKLAEANPPVRAGGGGGGGASAEPLFGAAPPEITIIQSGNLLTLTVSSQVVNYTLDDKMTDVPPGDPTGLHTHAHWDGEKLHLHNDIAHSNWGRDILSLNGGTLTVQRDLDTGGGSTTRMLTYSKQ